MFWQLTTVFFALVALLNYVSLRFFKILSDELKLDLQKRTKLLTQVNEALDSATARMTKIIHICNEATAKRRRELDVLDVLACITGGRREPLSDADFVSLALGTKKPVTDSNLN